MLAPKEKTISATRDIAPSTLISASPLASPALTSKLFDFLQKALLFKLLRKGLNETLKLLQKDAVEFVLLAGDTDPLELLASVVQVCEEKGVPYVFVPQSAGLGRASGVKRPVICACVVVDEKQAVQAQIGFIKDELEALLYF